MMRRTTFADSTSYRDSWISMFMSTLASVSLVLMPETTACIPMILRFVISEDFKQRIIDRSTTRVLSFLNIVGLWAASATLACRPVQG